MAAAGLKSYILNNNIKSVVLLAGFPLLLILVVYALELIAMGAGMLPRSGGGLAADLAMAGQLLIAFTPLAFTVAGIWFVIAYFAQSAIINGLTGAVGVSRAEAPEIYNLLENLAISRGMKTPTLHLIEDMSLNAYATGLHEGQYSVTLTRGLIERLNRDELEAVIGHELTHIINKDVRLMVICAVFAGIISLVGQLIYRITLYGGMGRSRNRDGNRSGGGALIIIGFVAVAVAYVLAIVLRFAVSRQAEYLADAGSVELTKNPDAMIRALQKISGDPFVDAPEQLRGMFIEDPSESLMATHPSIEKRIAALVQYAGGRVDPNVQLQPLEPPADYPVQDVTGGDYVEPQPAEPPRRGGPWGRRGPWG